MVALEDESAGDPESTVAYLNEHWGFTGPFVAEKSEGGSAVYSITAPGGALLFVTHIDMPIPMEELQFACETSMGWVEACDQLKRMKSHAIVASMGSDHMDTSRLVFIESIVTQAVAAQSKPIGVYLGGAESVWSDKQWSEMTLSSTEADPPYLLWIGLKAQKNADGSTSVATRGLTSFNSMNVEVQNTTRDGNEALEFVADTATYLISSGATINDGDTIGSTVDEKIKITYGPSFLDPEATVYQVHF